MKFFFKKPHAMETSAINDRRAHRAPDEIPSLFSKNSFDGLLRKRKLVFELHQLN